MLKILFFAFQPNFVNLVELITLPVGQGPWCLFHDFIHVGSHLFIILTERFLKERI